MSFNSREIVNYVFLSLIPYPSGRLFTLSVPFSCVPKKAHHQMLMSSNEAQERNGSGNKNRKYNSQIPSLEEENNSKIFTSQML